MFHIVLFEPEIPPNTGNIIRLCANTGSYLHLIEPLGFTLNDKQLRRAGLDYHEWAEIKVHPNLSSFLSSTKIDHIWACSTKGQQPYYQVQFKPNDALLFGPETRGLPKEVLSTLSKDQILKIPMLPHSRSLNLSNAVAIVIYEAWRQQSFNF
ncbi:tRNA (uridine(34)/cytosine(34)/5-carboxymethylaminomethyluridine(34)-2'-O)-methyltransferase TrmL [Candidatus Nitrosacidococcus sp. I8]|uniref:tRNA (uridine(34)/cytosine(34)/5- carboxymethylaminomethyluridine(34)-2'-O)- methyltransferase TrmL n=1 Tax=Candidatus Nitrosacidococcus sp. I8 TaxID=2942908 RepID=UPI002226D22C|nr:tRNA (uridine(34)/cytosine(34)/5-carboxymethylaminomethyluridine(34)-2'-O)-methyltransferase TrmL [Candidatus Nitrosacidococcus sp. I8]CAH9015833.1 tRNA (cytidine(34)-2'-O)-methyltransferase [Candidatus Nitrosacidococcus sp. I8]